MGRSHRFVARGVSTALALTVCLAACGQSRAATQSVTPASTTVSSDTTSVGSPSSIAETYPAEDGSMPTFPTGSQPPMDAQIAASTPIGAPHQCAGVDTADTTTREDSGSGFDPPAVVAIAICRDGWASVHGLGRWSTRETRQVPAGSVAGVASAMAAPNAPNQPGLPCNAIGYILPPVVATMADGTKRMLPYPYGPCYPQQHPIDAVYAVLVAVPPEIERIEQVLTETETVNKCNGAKTLGVADGPPVAFPLLLADNVSICYYDGSDADQQLVATGQLTEELLVDLVSSITASPPTGCEPGSGQSEVPTFLTLVDRMPTRPEELLYGHTVLSVGLDPCHVVLDDSWHIVGWASDHAVGAMTAVLVPVP
jgi:hypothetical protein